jgi:hypothetical protein
VRSVARLMQGLTARYRRWLTDIASVVVTVRVFTVRGTEMV